MISIDLKDMVLYPSVRTYKDMPFDQKNLFKKLCNREVYPLMVSPLNNITDENNYKIWLDNKVTPLIPLSVNKRIGLDERLELSETTFVCFTLDEMEEYIGYEYNENYNIRYMVLDLPYDKICSAMDICERLKESWGDKLKIMVRQVNSDTLFKMCCQSNIDYVCFSETFLNAFGINYPILNVLTNIRSYRCEYPHTKVIYESGVEEVEDILKLLSAGVDFIMLDRVFAHSEEACGEIVYALDEKSFLDNIYWNKDEVCYLSTNNLKRSKPWRHFKLNSDAIEVKWHIKQWLDNFESELKLVMYFLNTDTIDDIYNNTKITYKAK